MAFLELLKLGKLDTEILNSNDPEKRRNIQNGSLYLKNIRILSLLNRGYF